MQRVKLRVVLKPMLPITTPERNDGLGLRLKCFSIDSTLLFTNAKYRFTIVNFSDMIVGMLILGRNLTTSHSPDGIIETCRHSKFELVLRRDLTTSHSPDGIIETCCHAEVKLILGRDLTTSHSPDGVIEICCHGELQLILGRDLTTSHSPHGIIETRCHGELQLILGRESHH